MSKWVICNNAIITVFHSNLLELMKERVQNHAFPVKSQNQMKNPNNNTNYGSKWELIEYAFVFLFSIILKSFLLSTK